MKKYFLITAILMVAWSAVTPAQQQSSVPAKNAESPAKLLLEVVFNPALPPSYTTVAGPDEKAKWVWFGGFVRRVSIEPRIDAVKLESKFNGETADVRVTLLRGSFDREDLVGVYHVHLDEQITLNDLQAAGVEPFTIKLVSMVPSLPPQPAFENHTKSIEIVSVQVESLPKPAYRVTFRNLSEKHLLALRVDVIRDNRPGTSSLIKGEDGKPAIEGGGTLERYMPVDMAQRTPTGYAPGSGAANTIMIRTAVFADMSFEGESESACLFESFVMADRAWLRRVVALLDEELTRPANEDQVKAARQFKEKITALRYEFDETERNQASIVSPVCPKPFGVAKASSGPRKLQLLHDLDETPSANFRAWLETRRSNYKAWLARLEKS